MNYSYFKSLSQREQVSYLVGLIKYWYSKDVTDKTDILRELKLNTNNDGNVIKITNIILKNM